ncbi:MAG: RNA methyltransferase [Niabella sp.]|nr:RNA methyltransferase [Niabella sp.]
MIPKSEIKYIQTLFQKKFRDAEGLYLAEGPKILDEARGAVPAAIQKIFGLDTWINQNRSFYPGVEMNVVAEFELEKISQLKTPNQVVAVMAQPVVTGAIDTRGALVLVLDGIQDPGNLGTIVRIADWFGVPQVVCSRDCADIYSAKVVQATMGSLFRVPVHYTELSAWVGAQKGTPVYGAVLNGTPLKQVQNVAGGILVIGNESKGIRPKVEALLTEKITIEKTGGAESLNAAVATGILLAHLK